MIEKSQLQQDEFYHIETFPGEFKVAKWTGRAFYYGEEYKSPAMFEDVYSVSEYTEEPEEPDPAHPSGVECIDITEHFNFNLGRAIECIWRAGLEEDGQQDLAKARWYIDREISRVTDAES